MSVSTHPVSWPTEASFKPLDDAFCKAYNELEAVVLRLRSIINKSGGWSGPDFPDPPPTFETVGVLYNALDCIRMDLWQCTEQTNELESQLDEINAMRREIPVRKEDGDAS